MADWLNRAAKSVPPYTIYIAAFFYLIWLFYLGATGGMGVEPIKALEHAYGQTALKLIVLGLAITPLRQRAGINLIRFRRAIGLSAFMYIVAHLLVWLVLDVQVLADIWADIVKRPYITIGMVGFALAIPLAVTSNDTMVRRLGRKWRRLHQLTYLMAILGAAHFVMLSKGLQIEPLAYLAVILALLALRLPKIQRFRTQ